MVTGYQLGTGGVNYSPIGTGTIGILNPTNGKDKYVKIAIGGILNRKPQQSIEVKTLKSAKNPNGLDVDDLHTALSFINDTKAGSGLDELKKAYQSKGYSPKLTEDNFNFIKNYNNQSTGEGGMSTLGKIATTSLGLGVGGKTIKGIGKYIYKNIGGVSPTMEQVSRMQGGQTPFQRFFGIVPEGASTEKVRTTPETVLERGGITKQTGGNIVRGTTARQVANRIWRKEVTPVLKKITNTFHIDDIAKSAEDYANKLPNAFEGTDYKNGLKEVIEEVKKTYGKTVDLTNMTAQQIQDLRSHVMKMDIPQSAYRGTVVKESYKQGAIAFVNGLKQKLIEGVKSIGGNEKKFSRAYDDFGNLVNFAETAKKKAGTVPSQNLQQMISSTTGSPVSASSTFIGKTLYKVGQGLDEASFLPTVKRLSKLGLKGIKNIGKGLFAIDPVYTPDLLQNIPGTIGKSFKTYMENSPVGQALKGMEEMGKSREDKKTEIKKRYPSIDDETLDKVVDGKVIII